MGSFMCSCYFEQPSMKHQGSNDTISTAASSVDGFVGGKRCATRMAASSSLTNRNGGGTTLSINRATGVISLNPRDISSVASSSIHSRNQHLQSTIFIAGSRSCRRTDDTLMSPPRNPFTPVVHSSSPQSRRVSLSVDHLPHHHHMMAGPTSPEFSHFDEWTADDDFSDVEGDDASPNIARFTTLQMPPSMIPLLPSAAVTAAAVNSTQVGDNGIT
jgi:hypothetical protein